jgi:TolB-like protein
MTASQPLHILRRSIVHATAAIVLLCAAAPLATAQPAAFQDAKEAYEFAEFERAITLFSDVAQDTTAAIEYRRESLRYLGRAYIARNKRGEAREALRSLVELEPPIVELDPDREPPTIMDLYYEVRKQVAGSYQVERRDPGLQTIAILDFTNSSVDERERYDSLTKGFPSMMVNYMNGATDLKVIERERLQWLLKELDLQRRADVVDQSTAVRMGKLMGASTMLFGSYIVHEDRMWLSARLVKVETSEVLLTERLFGEPDEFFDLVEKLSLAVTRAINVEMEETELGTGSETRSLDAMMAYSDGLVELEQGNYRAAYEQFLKAKEYDPNYERAQIKMESLKPMLASIGAEPPRTTESDGRP